MTSLFTSTLAVLLQRNTRLSLSLFSAAAAFFALLAVNAAKFSIPFGRVKRQSQKWWSPDVDEADSNNVRLLLPVMEVMKIFFDVGSGLHRLPEIPLFWFQAKDLRLQSQRLPSRNPRSYVP